VKGLVATGIAALLLALVPALTGAQGATLAPAFEGDFVIRDFHFASGESLPQLRIHYRTFGKPRIDAQGVVRNAVLILHGTSGSGGNFVRAEFSGELFGAGQPLDAARYFIVLPDGIGHGKSSKPSDGLHAHFPRYGYRDMVQAQYLLLTQGLKVNHARLVMGTSMGGMHTWLWAEQHPSFMDALMPLASLPTQVSGRNRVWRRLIIDAIRNDPDWNDGEYHSQPAALRTALAMLWLMSSNPVLRQQEAPTLAQADQVIDAYVDGYLKTDDANDLMYAAAASYDYDPGPGLEKISAPLLAVNSADDLINPPELKILEHEIGRVAHGRAIIIPYSEHTRGHGSHTIAALWKQYLEELLNSPER
jgi:homoserine O-acetyltransferase